MPTDPITLPATTDSMGTVAMTHVFNGLRKRHWWHVLAISIDHVCVIDDEFLTVDATQTGGVTVTLEDPADVPGKAMYVHNDDSNGTGDTTTVLAPTGVTVDGSASITLTTPGAFVYLVNDGVSNWILVNDGR